MAMALDVDDFHWPSLAPIRTSSSTSCLHAACDTISNSSNLPEEGSLHDAHGAAAFSCMRSAAPFNASSPSQPDRRKASHMDLARQFSCCYTNNKTCIDLFSCFSCTKQTSSPRPQRRCTPTCMRKNGPVLRSMAFLFPTGGFQSFYSSPRGKAAQLSGASSFPRTLSSSKLQQHYPSPRTPGNHPGSGKIQHFGSPRTPGSGNRQCLSAPRTPASGKVQHFSGAITSPRTPFGSGAASPSSGRRRRSGFTLFMPPGTADKKKTGDQLDEPTSPHVTCIGRVRRQTQCKKPHHKDIVNPHAHGHEAIAKKKGTYSKKSHSGSGTSKCPSIASNEETKSSTELSTSMEACKQKFGRSQLHNLHKIHGFGDESGNANDLDQVALDCNQGDDITNGHIKDLKLLDSQNHGKHSFDLSNAVCINGNMKSLEQANHNLSENIRIDSVVGDKVELSVDTPVLHTTCSQTLNDLQQEAHEQSKCLEILNELQHEAHQSQCEKPALQINASKIPQSTDHYLLLMRNSSSSSRKLSDFDSSSFSIS